MASLSFAVCSDSDQHKLSLKGKLTVAGNGNIFWADAPFYATKQNKEKIFSNSPFRKTEDGWTFLVDKQIVRVKGSVELSEVVD